MLNSFSKYKYKENPIIKVKNIIKNHRPLLSGLRLLFRFIKTTPVINTPKLNTHSKRAFENVLYPRIPYIKTIARKTEITNNTLILFS